MNTVKASVAGIAFTFERSAYDILEGYISRLEGGYKYAPDGAEIIADIEARIAELLLSEQEADKVVGTDLAQRIVDQLGFPDDLNTTPEEIRALPRRLYRNPKGAMLGGVCSGLGTYFGIDPVWLRLAVILSLIGAPFLHGFTGTFVLAYLILWTVVPMARTPRQQLEMTGAPITAERIEQQLRSEATAAFSNVKSQRSASVWARLLYVLGQVFMVFVKIIIGIFVFAFAMAAIGIVVAIIAILCHEPYSPVLEGLTVSSDAYVIMLLFAVLIPLAVLIYVLGAALFNGRTHKSVILPASILWVILVVFLSVITVRNHKTLEKNLRSWDEKNITIGNSEHNDYNEKYFDAGEKTDTTNNLIITDDENH